MLRLPRNLYLTLRKCCACHAVQSLGKVDLAKVLRLPRNLHPTLPKCCACHAIQSSRNLCVAVPMGPAPSPLRARSKTAPRPLRDRSETAPTRRGGQASFLISGDANSRTGSRFLRLSLPLPHACDFFSRAYFFSCHLSQRASFQLVAVTRKFLLNFL